MERDIYAYLKEQKTDMIENNRLSNVGGGKRRTDDSMVGDYDTPEQKVGKLDMNVPWESCFTLSSQWAWKPNDNIKSLDQCLDILSKTSGGNGNLLLNVGPMPDGRIDERQVTRQREIGECRKSNGDTIYNTFDGLYEPTDTYEFTHTENKNSHQVQNKQ